MVIANYISIALSTMCLAILFLVYFCIMIEHDRKAKLIRVFKTTILCNAGIIFFDIIAYLTAGHTDQFAFYMVRIANFLHYTFGSLSLTAVTIYVITYIEIRTKISRNIKIVVFSLCAISLLLTIISQFNGMYYSIDEFNIYHRGEVFWLSQVLPITGMLLNMGIVLFYYKAFEKKLFVFVLAYIVLPILALSLAMLYYGVTFINIAATLSVLLLYIGFQIEHSQNKSLRIKRMNDRLEIQKEYYKMLHTHIDETKKARHDLRYHISVFQSFIDTGETQKLAGYLSEYKKSIPDDTGLEYCENYAVNSILHYFVEMALSEGVQVDVHTELPEKISINDTDLCIIFGNCLENAIEASRKVEGSKFIKVSSVIRGDMLAITVDNSFSGAVIKRGEMFLSEKQDGGIGISSVNAVADKYKGETRFETKDNVFLASIMLQLG